MRGMALLAVVCACSERPLPIPERRLSDLGMVDLADSLTREEFVDQFAREICDHELRCGLLDEEELPSCLLYEAEIYRPLFPLNYQFHADVARRCLDKLPLAGCRPF